MTEEHRAPSTSGASVAINTALGFAVTILEGFDIQAIGVSAPKIAQEFGLPPDQMGWVFLATNLALVIGAGIGGWLADQAGRKPVFIVSVLAFGVATYGTTLASDFSTLLAARALAGLGFGAALPNIMAIAADISRTERRASVATAIFCGMPLGGGVVAAYTQTLPAGYDWRILFVVGGVLPILLAPLLLLFMRETSRPSERQVGTRGDAFRALFGQGRAFPTSLLWLAFFPTLLILYLILYWLPTLAVSKGLGPDVAPQTSVAFNFAGVAGALFFGRLVDKSGARWPLTIAFALLIASVLALSAVDGLIPVLVLSACLGALVLGANYALYGVAASYYPKAVRGTGSGAAIAIGRVGAIVGPLLPGLLLTSGSSANDVIKLMMPAAALAGLAVFALSFFRPPAED